MTMPLERTRSLRWMWEYLVELHSKLNVVSEATTASVREVTETIESILRHYPTPQEIADWARGEEKLETRSQRPFGDEAFLEPEPRTDAGDSTATENVWKRGATSPAQRGVAMAQAYELVRFGLSGKVFLSKRIKTQKMYVLRHYPDAQTMTAWILCERSRLREVPGYVGWLA